MKYRTHMSPEHFLPQLTFCLQGACRRPRLSLFYWHRHLSPRATWLLKLPGFMPLLPPRKAKPLSPSTKALARLPLTAVTRPAQHSRRPRARLHCEYVNTHASLPGCATPPPLQELRLPPHAFLFDVTHPSFPRQGHAHASVGTTSYHRGLLVCLLLLLAGEVTPSPYALTCAFSPPRPLVLNRCRNSEDYDIHLMTVGGPG